MSPHIIATVTIDDDHHRNTENCSPSSQDMSSPKPKGRVLYCRKCEGHGEKVILKNHSPQCPYILCNCKSCEKLNYKRLKSFNKRNKEKIELAAALNAKRHATESSSSVDDEEGYSRRSSFSSKTSTPDMDSDTRTSSTTPITRASPAVMSASAPMSGGGGLEGRSGSLGHMTVMSYDIWKAKCASEKKRLEEERAKKTSLDPFTRSPSPTPMRKRAHTFVAQPTTRTEEIPVVAPKKMSVDEKGKGKYILLPTIPAMRIFVNEAEDEKPVIPIPMSQPPMTQQIPMTTTTMTVPPQMMSLSQASILDIPPSTSAGLRTFPMTTTSPMLPRPAPVMAPPQLSPFKPVLPSQPLVNNLSTEQSISSLILHQTVLQQQQQNSLQDLLGGQTTTQPPVDVLSMIRLQQQAAALAAALQAAGVQLPVAAQPTPAPVSLPMLQKTLPTFSTSSLLNNPFLQSPLFTNPV
ncbi:CBN-DMD-6 protein [Caenorhabditis brenneri]|uniref:CBN-DMD-6 protein n=1 Tax=Caenorhabditis brenneri TaxID=135651 RepID=G0N6T0_CAEBE|nr:CBN-DMD-6 protein [Caenorhabditis brenneri]